MKSVFLLPLLPFVVSSASAATTGAFDGGVDTAFTAQAFNGGNGPSVQAAGGNPGGFLQVTPNENGLHNWATFDRTDAGLYPQSNFAFQFRIDNLGAGGADGISFSYYNTANHGTAGGLAGPQGAAEDPVGAGVLAFGFDTWGNGGALDANGNSADYSEISVLYNGALVSRVDDTRLLPTDPFNLKDGGWHSVTGSVDFSLGTVSLEVDTVPIFTNVAVPGLAAFESRVGFAGRTGNANERASIDNLNVQWVPEPAGLSLAGLAGLWVFRRRR